MTDPMADACRPHRLLERQLRRLGLSQEKPPDKAHWEALLGRISAAYAEAEQHHYLIERSTSIASAETHNLHEQLRWQATHDGLTHLPNRTAFRQHVERCVADPTGGTTLALLYIDLDRFKNVNDTLGHRAGDSLLVEMAHRLRNCTRTGELAARLAGDEFVVLCEGANGVGARRVAERIHRALSVPVAIGELRLRGGASIGIAVALGAGDTADALLHRADEALYAAKRAGRGCIVAYSELDRTGSMGWSANEAARRSVVRLRRVVTVGRRSRVSAG